jgi:cytochrome c-type biogenesis protein CcsB
MTDIFLNRVATFIYLATVLLYAGQFFSIKKKKILAWALLFAAAGFILQAIAFFERWRASYAIDAGHIPLASFYESLLFFSGIIVLISITTEIKYRSGKFGFLLLPLAFLVMAAAIFVPDINNSIEPLVPALKSGWLFFHVSTCIAGFAFFAATFTLGILHFIWGINKSHSADKGLFSPDKLLYQFSVWGFAFLTAGILSGASWAQVAWGSYWSWDPKETCSLITWLIYALLLHLKSGGQATGRNRAILAIIGFIWVLITYWGTIFFSSLHSYN